MVFLPVLFFLVDAGGWAYRSLVALTIVFGAWEWSGLRRRLAGVDRIWLMLGALGVGAGASGLVALTPLLGLYAAATLLLLLRHGDGGTAARAGDLLAGLLYVGLLPAFLIRIRDLPDGREALLLTYGAVFVCDSAAYGVGRAIGRHALWARVSPKKTWEGAIGGLVGAMAAAVVARYWVAPFLSLPAALGFGALVGSLGQVGDLIESQWKREAGVKDSSQIIPGHGGVLDRFDNLHFVAPILYTYLALCI